MVGKRHETEKEEFRPIMANRYKKTVHRATGLILISIGIGILAKIGFTDLSASFNQGRLRSEWNANPADTSGASRKIKLTAPYPSTQTAAAWPAASIDTQTTHESTKEPESTATAKRGEKVPVHQKFQRVAHKQPFARIVIPKIKLDAIVVEGVDEEALKLGPGHMEETAYPGEIGNMVISGHRVTYSRPFYYLDELEKGDPIEIRTKAQKFIYYVAEKKVVAPTDISVIQPTNDRTLTLTTCNPRFSAKTRLIIVAKIPAE